MKTINAKQTKTETAKQIAESIRDRMTADCDPAIIGISTDGEVGTWYPHSQSLDDLAAAIYTTPEWSLGDFGGDPNNTDDWTDEAEEALAEWVEAEALTDAAIEAASCGRYEIEWPVGTGIYEVRDRNHYAVTYYCDASHLNEESIRDYHELTLEELRKKPLAAQDAICGEGDSVRTLSEAADLALCLDPDGDGWGEEIAIRILTENICD